MNEGNEYLLFLTEAELYKRFNILEDVVNIEFHICSILLVIAKIFRYS